MLVARSTPSPEGRRPGKPASTSTVIACATITHRSAKIGVTVRTPHGTFTYSSGDVESQNRAASFYLFLKRLATPTGTRPGPRGDRSQLANNYRRRGSGKYQPEDKLLGAWWHMGLREQGARRLQCQAPDSLPPKMRGNPRQTPSATGTWQPVPRLMVVRVAGRRPAMGLATPPRGIGGSGRSRPQRYRAPAFRRRAAARWTLTLHYIVSSMTTLELPKPRARLPRQDMQRFNGSETSQRGSFHRQARARITRAALPPPAGRQSLVPRYETPCSSSRQREA